MALTDEELFDFDRRRLGSYHEEWVSKAFAEMPDLYRNHLTIAKWIDGWRERMNAGGPGDLRSDDFRKGSTYALREIAAHMRQADFVPGGVLYEDTTNPGRPGSPGTRTVNLGEEEEDDA